MKLKILSTFCALSFVLTGCASIGGDNNRTVHINSQPAGAKVVIDNKEYGKTPTTVTLPSDIYGGKTVVLKKPGYDDTASVVNSKIQPIAFLDILFWPAIIVDGATGNLVKIDPASTNLDVKMQKSRA